MATLWRRCSERIWRRSSLGVPLHLLLTRRGLEELFNTQLENEKPGGAVVG
jgi:hypothetical protein